MPVSVNVPVPNLPSPPAPLTTPANVVFVLSLPVFNTPLSTTTLASVAVLVSDPIVWPNDKSSTAWLATVTGVVAGRRPRLVALDSVLVL